MEINYYKTFREVARWRSFTKAAEELGYAQSSVTTQIQKLEQEYGVKLFERWGKAIRPTPAGEQLLVYAEKVLALTDEIKEKICSEHEAVGSIKLGTVESLASFFLPSHLQKFQKEYPEIKLFVQRGISFDLIQGVKNGAFDFSVILDEFLSDPDLEISQIRKENVVLISSTDHRLTEKKRVTFEDLEGETMVMTEEGCSYRSLIERSLKNRNVTCHFSYELGSLESIKQCVSYGLGLSLLPEIVVKNDEKNGRIKILPFNEDSLQIFTQLVYRKKKWVSKPLRKLMDIIQDPV